MLVDPAFDSFLWDRQANFNIPQGSTILQDPVTHASLDSLWKARTRGFMVPTRDTSVACHGGSHTLTESTLSLKDAKRHKLILSSARNLSSPLDEMVIHWTRIADQDLITSARECSVNSAHYLLKYIANLWTHQLDLVQSTIARSCLIQTRLSSTPRTRRCSWTRLRSWSVRQEVRYTSYRNLRMRMAPLPSVFVARSI